MRFGLLDVEMLPLLKGQPWDAVAQAYVHALRPSEVRVSTGLLKSDACLWRVTVMTDDDGLITSITQEVEVALPAGIKHGYALACELDRRARRETK